MKYLAITQKTAEWLLNDSKSLTEIKRWFSKEFKFDERLFKGVAVQNSLRISTGNKKVLCLWNNDYVLGSGDEKWGFIRLDGELGLMGKKERIESTLDDFIFVLSKRLQGHLIDHPSKTHKSIDKTTHLVSSTSRLDTYAIVCQDVSQTAADSTKIKSLMCSGTAPSNFLSKQLEQVNDDVRLIEILVSIANNELTLSKSKPALDLLSLNPLNHIKRIHDNEVITPDLGDQKIGDEESYNAFNKTYEQWVSQDSTLTDNQRNILESDSIYNKPLRIIGAAGTGKSLLMQLLALRILKKYESEGRPIKILYVCHSEDMAGNVLNRFETLGGEKFILDSIDQQLQVSTLFRYCYESSNEISGDMILSPDAIENKELQRSLIGKFLGETIEEFNKSEKLNEVDFPIISKLIEANARDLLIDALVNEIGVAIKGRIEGIIEQNYTESEYALSRLHKILKIPERKFVFEIYRKYNTHLFESEGFLDSDDVAISFLQNKKTPVWNLRRKTDGFDFVFVDETQLFNENERKLFSLLTKSNDKFVPVVLALDEAQDLRGAMSKGFGALGISMLEDMHLTSIHRCSQSVTDLAFYLIQQTTDLFGSDFPDFTTSTKSRIIQDVAKNKIPTMIFAEESIYHTLELTIQSLRKSNFRQIGVIVHSNKYWSKVEHHLEHVIQPDGLFILDRRGTSIPIEKPCVVLAKPETAGGQEFDVVICVGLEDGVSPEKVSYAVLQTALDQQTLREMYLSFTRAKNRLYLILSKNSAPNTMLQRAEDNHLLDRSKLADI